MRVDGQTGCLCKREGVGGRSGSGIYMPQWVGGGGCDGGERGEEKGVVPLRSPTVVAGCVGVGHRSGEED